MICSRWLGMDQEETIPLQHAMQSTGDFLDENGNLTDIKTCMETYVKYRELTYFWTTPCQGLAIGICLDKSTERWTLSNFLCNLFCGYCKLGSYVCGCLSTTEEMKIVWNACEMQPCCGEACCYFYPLPYRVN